MTDYDRSELERIARELGYAGWDTVPRVPRRNILSSLDNGGVRVTDDSLADVIADAVRGGA